jgi:hypothetical protein
MVNGEKDMVNGKWLMVISTFQQLLKYGNIPESFVSLFLIRSPDSVLELFQSLANPGAIPLDKIFLHLGDAFGAADLAGQRFCRREHVNLPDNGSFPKTTRTTSKRSGGAGKSAPQPAANSTSTLRSLLILFMMHLLERFQ